MVSLNLLLSYLILGNMILFDFNKDSDLRNWMVVDDVVMGGRSEGNLELNKEGNAVFWGEVSLENNGGFSSVRFNFEKIDVPDYSKLKIRLKGDGKQYQFRVKSSQYDRHSYVYSVKTSGEWETITVPLSEMQPSFRGRSLNIPNYPVKELEEVAILIANYKAELFRLEIDKITLE